jgi:hypothetical protein
MFFVTVRGRGLYGKVDQVPGLFYVATLFTYENLFPMVPIRSYLIFEGDSDRGIRLPLQRMSVLVAYLRGIGFGIAPVSLLPAGFFFFAWYLRLHEYTLAAVLWLGLSILPIVFAVASYWMTSASRARAVALAVQAGLDPTFVHEHFDRLEGKDVPERDLLKDLGISNALETWKPRTYSEDFSE